MSGTDASFRGIDVLDESTAWVSGTGGTVLKTTDAGVTWQRLAVPESQDLDFRDIEILTSDSVLLMSAGTGAASRIYKTDDGGATWRSVYANTEELAFFNGFSFWDERRGVLASDPIDGKLLLLMTEDGGESWERIGGRSLPPLLEGEYGFAASGTNIATAGEAHLWVVTGGAAARVFHSADAGSTWQVFETPIRSGVSSSGIFSIGLRDATRGVIVGGDFENPRAGRGNVAWTVDGGRSWTLAEAKDGMPHKACVRYLGQGRYLAAGRTGLAFSEDDGVRWRHLELPPFYTIGFAAESGVGYLAGNEGQIARFRLR